MFPKEKRGISNTLVLSPSVTFGCSAGGVVSATAGDASAGRPKLSIGMGWLTSGLLPPASQQCSHIEAVGVHSCMKVCSFDGRSNETLETHPWRGRSRPPRLQLLRWLPPCWRTAAPLPTRRRQPGPLALPPWAPAPPLAGLPQLALRRWPVQAAVTAAGARLPQMQLQPPGCLWWCRNHCEQYLDNLKLTSPEG